MLTSQTNLKEDIVKSWLQKHGYFRTFTAKVGTNNYIAADAERRRILVKVVSPNEAAAIDFGDGSELMAMLEVANTENRECWIATVVLNERNQLEEEIRWRNLMQK